MKVYLSNYRNHWLSPYTIIDYVFFWTDWSKCSRNIPHTGWTDDKNWIDHPKWVEEAVNYLDPFCRGLQWVLDRVHPRFNYVKLDRWDTWSMDYTLAYIILPMLKQLKETNHGAPQTDDEDVPDELKSTNAEPKENEWDTDSNHFQRWNYIMDEMIWAFEQKLKDDDEHEFFDHSAYEKVNGKADHDTWFKDMTEGKSKLKIDYDGLKAHQARKTNGYRLFGKYYEGLWD